jgi:type 2 lantibiotic biosynthesis protein LanM
MDLIGSGAGRWWSRALTLAERASRVRAGENPMGDSARDANDRPAIAGLDRWRRQRPFDRPEYLARRLAVDALSERTFEQTLVPPPDESADDMPPTWVQRIDEARGARMPDRKRAPTPSPSRDAIGLELARAMIEPLGIAALRRVLSHVARIRRDHPDAPFEPERVTQLFEPALWNQLVTRCMKVGILELNVARVQGRLVGDTPEARYADFARLLRTTDLRDRIFEEYPVLARTLVTASEYWEASTVEFLERLAADAAVLRAELVPGQSLGLVSEVVVGAGDVHRHGRSVMIVAFSSGTRVVYKPRSLAAEVQFERLVEWLNDRGQSPPLRAVQSIDRGTHGWAEFAPRADCASADAVGRFYERFGSYVALLHVLEATDFHYENVIAAGEHPMLVDLEALFHPRYSLPSVLDEPEWIGWSVLQQSVLRAGVLPIRAYGNEESAGIDVSAVGGGGAQQTPNRFPVLVDAGTDAMRLERSFVTLPESQNRPALGGEPIDPARYGERIVAGFTSTYRLIARHRDELLAENGLIASFASVPIRVVLRPTRQYALILGESYHPDVLRDALDRDRLLDRLWVAIPSRPELERVVAFEHADLVAGDVPLFTTRPDSRDLVTTHGALVEGFFVQSGMDAALARIRALSESDLQRQQWVVRASLVALATARHEPMPLTNAVAPATVPNGWRSATLPSADASIAAADRVARRLSELALRQGARVSWLGLTLAQERDWVIQPVGADLYGGTLGISLFLAHVADITRDSEHAALARDAVQQVVERLEILLSADASDAMFAPGSIGAFGLPGGAVYVLSHLGTLWTDSKLLDVADQVAARVHEGVNRDAQLDVIAGAAGLIMALAALDAARPGGTARDVMRSCAEHLLAKASPLRGGIGWMTKLDATQPLTGFSHGASGIAVALFTAGSVLGDPRYTDAALAALRYERSTFDSVAANWPDYRILDRARVPETPALMWSWCHGAPGIGLARLVALQHLRDTDVRNDLDLAIASTVANGFPTNDSLCHGDLGNLELLVRAREVGFGGSWETTLASEASRLVERLARGEWRCGIPGGVETPGLMMGLAGIGYGLLRLGATERVPSVLTLEAPRGVTLRGRS